MGNVKGRQFSLSFALPLHDSVFNKDDDEEYEEYEEENEENEEERETKEKKKKKTKIGTVQMLTILERFFLFLSLFIKRQFLRFFSSFQRRFSDTFIHYGCARNRLDDT